MKKKLLIAAAALLCFILLAGCAPKNNNALKVGMELAYPPFETKDAQGNPSGVSVDFAKALGEYLGRPVEVENISWDGLIPALQTKKVDLVISSMTIKEERLEKINFSKPYAKALLAILANHDASITSIDDLNQEGKSVVVKLGSTGNIYAEKYLNNAEIIVLADESACVTEVVQGKADAFIYDQLTIYRNHQKNSDTTDAVYIPFQEVEYWGVGLNKENTELLQQVNVFIDAFYAEGGFDELTEKHLSEEKEAFDAFGFEWFFTNVDQ